MAFPRRDFLAVDGVLLHHQRAPARRFLHRKDDASRPAWVELAGCLVLALPYIALVSYNSISFVESSYVMNEQSDSTVGLTHRWIIKGVYAAGLWMVVLGIVSVLLRVIVFLFSGKTQEEVNLNIGHVETDI